MFLAHLGFTQESKSSTVQSDYYLSLVHLVVHLGTDVLLKVFKKKIPSGDTIKTFVNKRSKDINYLRNKNTLYENQYRLIVSGDEAKFDISLLYVLIRYLTNIEEPVNGWDGAFLSPHDRSAGAALNTLKKMRNEAVVHNPKGALTESEFERFWKEAEEALVELAGEISQQEKAAVQQKIVIAKSKALLGTGNARLSKIASNLEAVMEQIAKQDVTEEGSLKLSNLEMKGQSKNKGFHEAPDAGPSSQLQARHTETEGGRHENSSGLGQPVDNPKHGLDQVKIEYEDVRPPQTLPKDENGILNTLQDYTKMYITYNTSQIFSTHRVQEAKVILKQHNILAISGPRSSGKTSLATKLMADYLPNRCVLLQRPSDMRYIRLGDLSIVLVEDFAGKFEPNKQTAIEWYGVFDVLLPAVLSKKLSVIIVSEAESFKRCQLPTHDILRYGITLESGMYTHSDQWGYAIKAKDEDAITQLLKDGKLPNSNQIRYAFKIFRRNTTMAQICLEISHRIRIRDGQIVSVEPAYKYPGEDDVTFIVYVKKPTDLEFADIKCEVEKRVIGQYSSEGKEIVEREVSEHLQFTVEEASRLRTCIEKHSTTLMGEHSNLQMISASHYKSKNWGDGNLKKTLCVALYVRVKGFIPLSEEHLPNKLDEIPTDIREGGFEFLAHADERHTHLKMGCEISADKIKGTIGPFIKHEGEILCLTAAHVLVGPPKDNTFPPWTPTDDLDKMQVYQPAPVRVNAIPKHKPFGHVYAIKYQSGGSGVHGIDAAAILITDKTRLPNSGEFPEPRSTMSTGSRKENEVKVKDNENKIQNFKYVSGKVCDRNFLENESSVEILKFGAVTGATRGLLHFNGTCVRYVTRPAQDLNELELHAQIEMTNNVEGKLFADYGDSGAVVLAANGGNRKDLRALGLLVGKSSTGTILATPMHAILKEFGFPDNYVMAFQEINSRYDQAASAPTDDILRHLDETFKDRLKTIEKAVTDNEKDTSAIRLEMGKLSNNFENFNTAFEKFATEMMKKMPNQNHN